MVVPRRSNPDCAIYKGGQHGGACGGRDDGFPGGPLSPPPLFIHGHPPLKLDNVVRN